MSNCAGKTCLICCRSSSLQYVILNAPIGCGPAANTATIEDQAQHFTYWDCLRFCSKLEFAAADPSQLYSLCYACAGILKKTCKFLQQVEAAHQRMLLHKTEAKDNEEIVKQDLADDENMQKHEEVDNANFDETKKSNSKEFFEQFETDANEDICENDTNNFDSYETKDEVEDFNCNKCFRHFDNLRIFKDHYRHTHKCKLHYCQFCRIFLPNENYKTEHMKEKHSKLVTCDQCGYQCAEITMLRHKRNEHGSSNKFKCTYCLANFNCQYDLKIHLNKHLIKQSEPISCSICNKPFTTQRSLQRHQQIHSEKRASFECPQCSKKYICKESLDRHMRIHNGTAVQCQVCHKSCTSFAEMKVHLRFHTADCPLICEICGMQFKTKSILSEHMWRHQDTKMQCNQCHKLFTSARQLKDHSVVHTSKPFACRQCGKKYRSKKRLQIHLKELHNINFSSEELQKSIIQKETLTNLCAEP